MSSVIVLTGSLVGLGEPTFRFRGEQGIRHQESVAEPMIAVVVVAASTTVQLLGGVSPVFPSITTAALLALYAPAAVSLAFQGADITTEALPVTAGGTHIQAGTAITEWRVRNAGVADVEVQVLIGGA